MTGRSVRVEPHGASPVSRAVRIASAVGVGDAGRALRDFATYLPTQAIPAFAGFLALPILARVLTPTELGLLAIAQTLISLGWIATAQWLTSAMMREYETHRTRAGFGGYPRTLVRGLGVAALFLGIFVTAIGLVGREAAAVRDNLALVALAVGALVIQNVAVTLFAAALRPRAYAVVEVLGRTGGIVLGIVLVFDGHGVRGYLLGLAVASALAGGIGLAAAWPRRAGPPIADAAAVSAWLRYGTPIAAAAAAAWGLSFADRYLLALLRDTGSVGIYTVGNVIGDKAVVIPTLAFFTAARPLLFVAFERGGRAEVERLMRAYTRIVILVAVPAAAFVATTAAVLVPLLSGERYYGESADVVAPVALGAFFVSLALVGNTGLTVARRTVPLIYSATIGLGANIVANLLLIPPFGVMGAAVATPIGTLAFLLSSQWWARRYATWHFPWATLARALAAAAFASAAAQGAIALTEIRAVALGTALVSGTLVYLGALAVLGERRTAPDRKNF